LNDIQTNKQIFIGLQASEFQITRVKKVKGKCKCNVEVKFSLYLTKNHAMKKYWGSVSTAPRIL